jgi:CheY-like chemotaxis protein
MLAQQEAQLEAPEPRRLRILVVEDDPGMRALCGAVLKAEGFDVLEAADGREGLARAFSELPDLVLCDIAMPILDGFGLAVALRHNAQTRRVPLVFLTAETEPYVERHAYDAGAVGFFTKPFEPSTLISFIKRALALPESDTAQVHAV